MKLGVSLFSYSGEYYRKLYSLDELLLKAREAGAEGIEIVAAQMVKGFPYPSREWLSDFRNKCEKLALEPFCYSAHLDSGLRSDRFLSDDEKVESTVNDLRSAAMMGAQVVRTQFSFSPELLYKIEPWTKRYGVRLGIEIHPPHRLDTPLWLEFEKVFRDLDTPYIGMVLDTGIYQEYPYAGWIDVYARHGVKRTAIDYMLSELAKGTGVEAVSACLAAQGENEYAMEMAKEMFSLYRPYREDELRELIRYVTHFHTKFYHMENGEEKTIPYSRILKIAQDAGYTGYLMSEYEGHYCYDCEEYPATEQVRQHIDMEKRILNMA